MNLRIRGKAEPLRSSVSFAMSGWVHGSILAWLAFSPGTPRAPRSLYEQTIQPHEKHLVWYSMRDRLPDIAPAGAHKDNQLPRAREKFNQTIVAGAKDLPGPKQLISMPAPEIKIPELLALPNVVAVSPPPRPVKLFAPPVAKPAPTVPVTLPDAPRITPKVEARKALEIPVAKPVPRAFTPPVVKPKAAADAALPDAPNVNSPARSARLAIGIPDPRAPLRAFTPPPASHPKAPLDPAALPDAPSLAAGVQSQSPSLAIPDPRAPLRAFKAPVTQGKGKAAPIPDLPSAPETGRSSANSPTEASLAIVGMNPVKAPDFPAPPGSRPAGFSAGPEIRPKGGDGGVEANPMIVVPGLLVRGGAKDDQPSLVANASPTSRESLLAAARTALGTAPTVPAESHAVRMASAPDPRLEGRTTYTVAIQMPNITSYSGSWIVWFAEREPLPGGQAFDMRAPIPQRKVDPKYIAAAAEEKVEGKVRLFAVIRKDGHVDSIALLRHLDDRLDRSAQEALLKWVFEPALHNGVPIDVDAVFEIPFHLAPQTHPVMRQFLIIDADDTLWENNIYFERAFDEFVEFLNHSALTPKEVRDVLDEIEAANARIHGYGSLNFGRNLRECYEHLAERDVCEDDLKIVMGFAERILECPMEVIPGVVETLEYLSSRHDLTLFTKGHSEEQKLKLDRSRLGDFFAHTAIVKEKDAAAYHRLVAERGMVPERTWMIGNSPKSDVNPALEAGLNAVFVPHAHTWVLEKQDIVPGNGRLLEIQRFADLRRHF